MKGLGETEDSSCPWEAPLGSSCEVRAPPSSASLAPSGWVCSETPSSESTPQAQKERLRLETHFSLALQAHLLGYCSQAGTQHGAGNPLLQSQGLDAHLWQKPWMGLLGIHFNVLLMGLFARLRLERKLHSPDSLAAKVLDLISNSPNRIPHGDLDLGTESSGRRQASGHPFAGKRSRGSTILQSAASGSSGSLYTGAAFLVRRDTMNLAAGSYSWKFSKVSALSAPPMVL